MTIEQMQERGVVLAREWIALQDALGPTSTATNAHAETRVRTRAEKQARTAVKRIVKAMPANLGLDKIHAARIADKLVGEIADAAVMTTLPAMRARIADLAGVRRGLTRDVRPNSTDRKRQNYECPHAQWRAVADLFAPDIGDPEALFEDKRDFRRIARALWLASIATGLRPIEWLKADVHYTDEDGRRMQAMDDLKAAQARRSTWTMWVANAKMRADLDAPQKAFRTLRLGDLDPETQDAVYAASTAGWSDASDDQDLWRTWINRLSPKAGFGAPISLYDARQYVAWRAKQLLDPFEVAALMGHANIRSSVAYGAKVRERPKCSGRTIPQARLAQAGVAAPSADDVDFVHRRAAQMGGWAIDELTPTTG